MSIIGWPSRVREHRSWCEDENTELYDWYIGQKRFSLLWFQPGIWSVGIDRDQSGVYCLSMGKAYIAVEASVPPTIN